MNSVRHKVFLSYHKSDQDDVENFIQTFDNERKVFITRSMINVDMENDIINSNDTDYIMSRIRELYLKNSTVTIVMLGKCTWARKYIDWEIKSSLRSGDKYTPNGLLGILIPSQGDSANPPERLNKNLPSDDTEGYARWYTYPTRKDTLANWIEDAFQARSTRRHLINNSRDRFSNNRHCEE